MLYTSVILDWSDAAFRADVPVINAHTLAYAGALPEGLAPVFLRGNCGAPVFSGWPGVGYSPASFKMKAYIDSVGNIYHRDTRAGRVFDCPGKRTRFTVKS